MKINLKADKELGTIGADLQNLCKKIGNGQAPQELQLEIESLHRRLTAAIPNHPELKEALTDCEAILKALNPGLQVNAEISAPQPKNLGVSPAFMQKLQAAKEAKTPTP